MNFQIGTFSYFHIGISGSSSFGRAVAFQASGGRFEPGLPLRISLVFGVMGLVFYNSKLQTKNSKLIYAVVAQW